MKKLLDKAGLTIYMDLLDGIKHITADEERDLATRMHTGCARSRERLINAHLKLAVKIAMGYRGYGTPIEDLVADANVGLIRAVDKFKLGTGARLATYAMLWVRAQIMERIRSQRSIVRTSDYGEREYVPDVSLNVTVPTGEERIDLLVSEAPSPEEIVQCNSQDRHQRGIVTRLMSKLTPRQREVATRRLLTDEPPTLEVLGAELGVSKEAIRQQEVKAWDKMRRAAGVA